MGSKPNVLILTDWFVPGYKAGGPIQSVHNMVKALEGKISFSIITGDRDLLEDQPYRGIEVDRWSQSADYRVYYASAKGLAGILKTELGDPRYDRIYLNSFFSLHFSIKPLIRLWRRRALYKVVLAPRGMLGTGALSVKPFKKKVFIQVYKMLGIPRQVHFHATDITEATDIQKAVGNHLRLSVISNFPVQISGHEKRPSPRIPVKLLYASRISPKKNALFLLQVIHNTNMPDYRLDLYGAADDPAYFDKCRQFIETNDRISWHGAVSPVELYAVLQKADFFVLPTLNENFGHAIIEALAHGTPVIISDQTPWSDLESFGAGWVIPLADKARWKKVIEETARIPDRDYKRMSASAIEYVKRKFDFEEMRTQYLELFS